MAAVTLNAIPSVVGLHENDEVEKKPRSKPFFKQASRMNMGRDDRSIPSVIETRSLSSELDDLPPWAREYAAFRDDMLLDLDAGAMRFDEDPDQDHAPESFSLELSDEQRKCVQALREKWNKKHSSERLTFTDEMLLRFAQCSPGYKPCNVQSAWRVMKRFEVRRACLDASFLESQLLSKTLFPVPGLKNKDGLDMFYMRPSRYHPAHTPARVIIDNLAYTINCMYEHRSALTQGIGFLAYMDGSEMTNFATDYCFQFMQMLQGSTLPCTVNMVLIVNPPNWFNAMWKVMKPMLGKPLRKRVHLISIQQLPLYMEHGFDKFLPDDVPGGKVDTNQLVYDFVAYRQYVEEARHQPWDDGRWSSSIPLESPLRSRMLQRNIDRHVHGKRPSISSRSVTSLSCTMTTQQTVNRGKRFMRRGSAHI